MGGALDESLRARGGAGEWGKDVSKGARMEVGLGRCTI